MTQTEFSNNVHINPFSDRLFGEEELPDNLNDLLDAFDQIFEEWDDDRTRIVYFLGSSIHFRTKKQLGAYISGMSDLWEIVYDRLPDSYHEFVSNDGLLLQKNES